MGRLFLLAFIAARYAADDVLCEPGTRSVAGQSECEQCAPGTYASEAGSTECYLCEPDTFAEQSGQSACDECPAGKYAAVAGLIDPRGCTDPSQPAWMYLSFLVDGVNGEALVSEAGFSAFAYAISDVVSFLTRPQNILDLTATFGEDDAASIEVVIAMDTCATFGHSSNEDCLDHGVVDVANAVVDGAMLERILYWADYFGLDIGDDLTVDSIVSDPEPYWVYAPTAAPSAKPTAAPTTTTMAPAPEPVTTTAASPVTDAPDSGSSSKKKSSDDGLDSGAMAGIIIAIVVVLLLVMGGVYFKQRERKATERKDSWDISTMFTDEQNLPPADQMVAETPAGDQPQALQKITQAAEL